MDSEIVDNNKLFQILRENYQQTKSLQDPQERISRQRQIAQQIQEASKIYQVSKLDQDFYIDLQQDAYLIRVNEKIEIIIIFYYDFPKSDPKIFAAKQISHKLIDEDTLQIRVKWNDSLLLMIRDMVSQFSIKIPEDDHLMFEFQEKSLEDKYKEYLKAIQNIELRQIFTDCTPNKFLEKVKEDINPYFIILEEYKQLSFVIKEKAYQNKSIGEQIKQIAQENEVLKSQITNKLSELADLQIQCFKTNSFCLTLTKKFSDEVIVRVLDKKIYNLEQFREEKYENQSNEENEKKFEQDIKDYLEKRREYQNSIQKKQFLKVFQNKHPK